MKKKGIAIGESDFDALIREDCYYVDKSLFIKDVLESKAKITLITRPRRFGKTLNMNMLKSFLENNSELDIRNECKRHLFNGLKIEQEGDRYMQHFGQYPVIMLTFKSTKKPTWEESYWYLKNLIHDEFSRHLYLLDKGVLSSDEEELYRRIYHKTAEQSEFEYSVRFLSECLFKYYKKKAVILLDEYDVPLDSAWNGNYYETMISFIRSLFEAALKDNTNLAFAVMTGCLRISQESIFTGLNNPAMASIASFDYSEYFGFTQEEVDAMLEYYGFEGKHKEIREWYDGYLFGNVTVYNPWSVIKRIASLQSNYDSFPDLYWANTSGNDIVRKLIDKVVDGNAQSELETLMAGGTITKPINENITYNDIDSSVDNLWNFLFFTGYLKKVSEDFTGEQRKFQLSIPNKEVFQIYRLQISQWFNKTVEVSNIPQEFVRALIAGDKETAQQRLSTMLMRSISYFDAAESYYHGFLTAMFVKVENYEVKSNRETGDGRCDIFFRPYLRVQPLIIIEAKIAPAYKALETKCQEALQQIETNRYADEFIEDGYANIIKYGIAFYKKECLIQINKT
ncbi:MAG: ATP-binding protein [Tannerella sp.]|jgi:hypothetical protein|nr:ATP-binding protein [Tannerella sp.]